VAVVTTAVGVVAAKAAAKATAVTTDLISAIHSLFPFFFHPFCQ
jgi:hypothetical protein